MLEGSRAEPASIDTLATRLAAFLLLLAAIIFAACLAALLMMPRVTVDGTAGFAVPGTEGRHAVATTIIPVLEGVAGVSGLLGLLALVGPRLRWPLRPALRPSWRRPAAILAGGLAVLALVILRR